MPPDFITRRRPRKRRRKADDEERTVHPSARTQARRHGLTDLQRAVGNRTVERTLARRRNQPTADRRPRPISAKLSYALAPRRGKKGENTDKDKKGDQVETASTQAGVAGRVPMTHLSGKEWAAKFPTSVELSDLNSTFRAKVQKYLEALRKAGAKVEILGTRRPKERTYIMHWAWRIARQGFDPRRVPAMPRLNIDWWHGEASRSKVAAQAMVNAFGLNRLSEPPALTSHHNEGKAIDLRISWAGDLRIKDGQGQMRTISTRPRDTTNAELMAVGASYGVFHAIDADKVKVHWSIDGK